MKSLYQDFWLLLKGKAAFKIIDLVCRFGNSNPPPINVINCEADVATAAPFKENRGISAKFRTIFDKAPTDVLVMHALRWLLFFNSTSLLEASEIPKITGAR